MNEKKLDKNDSYQISQNDNFIYQHSAIMTAK